ncbi:MAG: carbon-nitrogen hydrolase family protein [Gammaproteobacteria bacterium]|nr:carbon-nitrogen hydrolase family protein [Gammaproteobacteria bacterium]
MKITAAVSQRPPVLLDLQASIDSALETIDEAVAAGAQLIVFPEAFLPGYPTWIWRLRPGADSELGNEIHARLRENAVDLAKDGLASLRKAARDNGVVLVVGFHELDSRYSGTTLFNSVAVIGPDGTILNRHRKMMPTNPERMVWGLGDASGLKVVDTPFGRIGSLICWENYMPLARHALYAQNIEIYVAPTWDCGDTWIASMNHIAREGGCWVLSSATALASSNIPADFPGRAELFPDEGWLNPGDAVVIKPFGGIQAGPLHEDISLLIAELDLGQARRARKPLDVAGHYGRPDLFQLNVDRRPQTPVHFDD